MLLFYLIPLLASLLFRAVLRGVLCSIAIKMFEQLIMNSFNTKSKK